MVLNKNKILEIAIGAFIAIALSVGIYSLVKTTIENKKVLTEVVTFLTQQIEAQKQSQNQLISQ